MCYLLTPSFAGIYHLLESLGWCLGQNKWCDYIEDDLSFICVIAGFNAAELTPKYPDCIKERVYALYDAVYWWHEYGKEAYLLNNV